jgi:hypothetical protein
MEFRGRNQGQEADAVAIRRAPVVVETVDVSEAIEWEAFHAATLDWPYRRRQKTTLEQFVRPGRANSGVRDWSNKYDRGIQTGPTNNHLLDLNWLRGQDLNL